MNIDEAFRALDYLNEDVFDVTVDGIEKLAEFESEKEDDLDELSVYDIDAEEEDDLEPSYVGKIILECGVCHSLLYHDKEDVEIDEDTHLANVGEECPFCASSDGFTVVGKVVEFSDEDVDDENEDEEESEIVKDETEVEVEESVCDEKCASRNKKSKDIKEEVDLTTKENTIASVLKDHMNEFEGCTDANQLRDKIMKVIYASNIADKASVKRLERDLYSKKSVAALLSTIATYMTGNKVIKPGRRESSKDKKPEQKVEGMVDFIDSIDKKEKSSEETDNIDECNDSADKDCLKEDFKDVSITTDDTHMQMTSDEEGRVTVTTEPIHDAEEEIEETKEEVIVPLEDEEMDDLVHKDEEEEEVEVQDFDEESFDELGESYLKRIYDNVDAYKTVSHSIKGNSVVLEGVIRFTSGNEKATSFKFESFAKSDDILQLKGSNAQLSEEFDLNCSVKGKTLVSESLEYSKSVKDEVGKSTSISGKISR